MATMATLPDSSPGPLPGLPDEAVDGAARAERRRRQGASQSGAAWAAAAAGERHQHPHPGGAGVQFKRHFKDGLNQRLTVALQGTSKRLFPGCENVG